MPNREKKVHFKQKIWEVYRNYGNVGKTKIYNEMIYEILIKRYLWNYYGLCIKIFVKIKGF